MATISSKAVYAMPFSCRRSIDTVPTDAVGERAARHAAAALRLPALQAGQEHVPRCRAAVSQGLRSVARAPARSASVVPLPLARRLLTVGCAPLRCRPALVQYIAELEELARDLAFENAFTGSHRCCAERRCDLGGRRQAHRLPLSCLALWLIAVPPSPPACRLLQTYVQQARKQGVPPQKLVAWVRRKLGGGIVVWRYTADGGIGRAAPCLFCSRELQRFDLLVDCSLGGGQWFHGRLSEPGAPTPQLTGGQQKVLRAQGWALCVDPKQPARGDAEQRPQGVTKKQEREWQQRGKGKGHAR